MELSGQLRSPAKDALEPDPFQRDALAQGFQQLMRALAYRFRHGCVEVPVIQQPPRRIGLPHLLQREPHREVEFQGLGDHFLVRE